MISTLQNLFNKLGYNSQNGLYILEDSKNLILSNFPSRISRILTEIIKPYAVFCVDAQYSENEHTKPFNNPLILFYENPTKKQYDLIPKHSFNLSRSPIVIISRNNNIEIFNGYNFTDNNYEWLEPIDIEHNLLSIKNLRSGKGWREIHQQFFTTSKTVDRFLLSNITDARRILVANEPHFPEGNLSPEVANRLIGRLIFIRYLIDRNVAFNDQDILIGSNKEERQQALNDMLLDHKKTYDFFEYITQKFKGDDLFPLNFENEGLPFLERHYVKKENLKVLNYLLTSSNMFVGKRVKGYSVQPSLFNVYDFEIIPVELISNIYESFLGNTAFTKSGEIITELSKQKEVKAYYTPPFLVDYVLSQTINPFLKTSSKNSCKVLDPSCGSGIFLVESLRQIIDKEIGLTSNSKTRTITNERLWELLEDNIYGIDIDQNAIEITIFSLYITLLDYKTKPKEIENFEFRPLKNKNLFGGIESDFFNLNSPFNEVFRSKIHLDFIIGNPPWGSVKSSSYVYYIKERIKAEKKDNLKLDISPEIGNKEISQAFMIRVEDLIQDGANTKICFIVTGKNLYNSDKKAKTWRKYFLSKFDLHQCFDLFGVNNKVAGGKQVFDNANQPPAIFLYSVKNNTISGNIVKHIAARANHFYHYFKTIVIEKNDVKLIPQKLLLQDDNLWKIILYGNKLDYVFINRLKENFPTIKDIMNDYGFVYNGGIKSKDGTVKVDKRKETTAYWDFDYIEVDNGKKDLMQYYVGSSKKFKTKLEELYLKGDINEDLKVPQITESIFFTGKKLLIKKGLDNYLNHKAVSAVTEKECVFSSTIASIVIDEGVTSKEAEGVLFAMSAIINSKFFTYYLLMTSSSFGADRNRVNFNEFFRMPFVTDSQLIEYSKKLHDLKNKFEPEESIRVLEDKIESKLYELLEVNEIEQNLIDYTIDVSIPVMKRSDRDHLTSPSIFRQINTNSIETIENYCNIFINHFSKRFNNGNKCFVVDVYINEDFIAINFLVTKKRKGIIKFNFNSSLDTAVSKIGSLGINNVSTDLFTQQDVRGFNSDSFYIIKPNIAKNWHLALAHIDLTEFIEAIAKSELKHVKLN